MALAPKQIRVYANPYQHVDPTYGPQAVVPADRAKEVWVGARLNLEETKKAGGKHVFEFDAGPDGKLAPQVVELTPYYLREVWCGDLVVADLESARLVGIGAAEFKAATDFLNDAQARAEADWKARYCHDGNDHGSPAFPGKLRTCAVERRDRSKAAPAAPSTEAPKTKK